MLRARARRCWDGAPQTRVVGRRRAATRAPRRSGRARSHFTGNCSRHASSACRLGDSGPPSAAARRWRAHAPRHPQPQSLTSPPPSSEEAWHRRSAADISTTHSFAGRRPRRRRDRARLGAGSMVGFGRGKKARGRPRSPGTTDARRASSLLPPPAISPSADLAQSTAPQLFSSQALSVGAPLALSESGAHLAAVSPKRTPFVSEGMSPKLGRSWPHNALYSDGTRYHPQQWRRRS